MHVHQLRAAGQVLAHHQLTDHQLLQLLHHQVDQLGPAGPRWPAAGPGPGRAHR